MLPGVFPRSVGVTVAFAAPPYRSPLLLHVQSGDNEKVVQINVCSSLDAYILKRAMKLLLNAHIIDIVSR